MKWEWWLLSSGVFLSTQGNHLYKTLGTGPGTWCPSLNSGHCDRIIIPKVAWTQTEPEQLWRELDLGFEPWAGAWTGFSWALPFGASSSAPSPPPPAPRVAGASVSRFPASEK